MRLCGNDTSLPEASNALERAASRPRPQQSGMRWAGGRFMRSAAGVLLVKYGVLVWLDRRWPEDWSERWGTHQTEVNLIPRGVISSKFGPSYLCTFLLSLSDDEVSESETLRRSFPELTLFSPPPCRVEGENRLHISLLAFVWGDCASWARGKHCCNSCFSKQCEHEHLNAHRHWGACAGRHEENYRVNFEWLKWRSQLLQTSTFCLNFRLFKISSFWKHETLLLCGI